jgi:hypothetical protein
MLLRKGGSGLGLLAILGLVFVAVALYAGVVQADRTQREAREVRQLPELSAAALARSMPGTTVAATGILAGDAGEEMLIYTEEEWQVERDDEGEWSGAWETINTVSPDATISLTDGNVLLLGTRDVAIDATLHEESIYVPEGASEVDGFVEGSIRHLGFRAGDQITTVGSVASEGIIPGRIVGGDRDALIVLLSQQVTGLRIVGAVLGLVGLTLMGIAVRLWLRP